MCDKIQQEKGFLYSKAETRGYGTTSKDDGTGGTTSSAAPEKKKCGGIRRTDLDAVLVRHHTPVVDLRPNSARAFQLNRPSKSFFLCVTAPFDDVWARKVARHDSGYGDWRADPSTEKGRRAIEAKKNRVRAEMADVKHGVKDGLCSVVVENRTGCQRAVEVFVFAKLRRVGLLPGNSNQIIPGALEKVPLSGTFGDSEEVADWPSRSEFENCGLEYPWAEEEPENEAWFTSELQGEQNKSSRSIDPGDREEDVLAEEVFVAAATPARSPPPSPDIAEAAPTAEAAATLLLRNMFPTLSSTPSFYEEFYSSSTPSGIGNDHGRAGGGGVIGAGGGGGGEDHACSSPLSEKSSRRVSSSRVSASSVGVEVAEGECGFLSQPPVSPADVIAGVLDLMRMEQKSRTDVASASPKDPTLKGPLLAECIESAARSLSAYSRWDNLDNDQNAALAAINNDHFTRGAGGTGTVPLSVITFFSKNFRR